MQMSDTRQIAVPPAQVYAALLDPEVLKSCVPGAQEVTGSVEDGFTATVVQKVGPVKATFKGEVTISDLVPDTSLKIDGSGKGGADVRVTEKDGGTELSYDVEAKVGGKLAQLGSRIIDGFAKKMADQFFQNLQSTLEGPAEGEAETTQEAPPKPGRSARSTDSTRLRTPAHPV